MNNLESEISLNDSTLKITNFSTNNSEVFQAFSDASINGRDLSAFLLEVMSLGAKLVSMASATAATEKLHEAVAASQASLVNNSQLLVEGLRGHVDTLTSGDGPLALKLNSIIKQLEFQLLSLTTAEDSPFRSALKADLESSQTKIRVDVKAQNDESATLIKRLLNLDSEESPLRVFSDRLSGIEDAMGDLRETIVVKQNVALEAAKGTAKGKAYEEAVLETMMKMASNFGDAVNSTGDSATASGAKVGDGIIGLKEGMFVKALVVIEAKNRKKFSEMDWRKEAKSARQNRNAIGFIGFTPYPDQVPGGQRVYVMDNLGQQMIVCFDPETDDTGLLGLVYQFVKTHCLTVLSGISDINPASINSATKSAINNLQRFDELRASAKRLNKEASTLLTFANDVQGDLLSDLKSIEREISTTLDALSFGSEKEITVLNETKLAIHGEMGGAVDS